MQKLCETSLQENGFEADVIAGEAGIIKAQLAYIEQRKGETAVALKLFEEIFESKVWNSFLFSFCFFMRYRLIASAFSRLDWIGCEGCMLKQHCHTARRGQV
jgi:hypothetical protein